MKSVSCTKNDKEYREVGDVCWFEYHCLESNSSTDAHLWRHTHQKVKILKIAELGAGDSIEERTANGQPAMYDVRFNDGLVYPVFEDEILEKKEQFVRPDYKD